MVFYGPISTLYRQAHGISIFEITVIESISLILSILFEIPWGVIADKIGYKKTMIFCCYLYFVSKIIFWQATNFSWFLAERIMLSVVFAGLSGVDISIIYLSCEGQNSHKVFGIYNSLQMIGLLIAATIFSLFVGENYSLSGFLTVISYGIASFLSLWLIEVKPKESRQICVKQFKSVLFQTLHNKNLVLFLIAVALLSETHQTITVFLNQLQYEKCGLNSSAIGYIYIVATLIGVCGVYSAKFTQKIGVKATGIFFGSMFTVSCILLSLTNSASLSVCGILLLRISNSLFQSFQTEIQNRQIYTVYRATALNIHTMIIDSIAVGTNLIFDSLAELNLTMAFSFGAIICMISIGLFRVWYHNSSC